MASGKRPPKDPLIDSPAKPRPPAPEASQANTRPQVNNELLAEMNRSRGRSVPEIEQASAGDNAKPIATPTPPTSASDNRSQYRALELGKSKSIAPNPAASKISPATEHGSQMHIHQPNATMSGAEKAESVYSRDTLEKSTKTVEAALSKDGQGQNTKSIRDRAQEKAESQQHSQTREKAQEKDKGHER